MRTVVTEASATPSVGAITLKQGQNALRVYTGYQPVSEAFFYLYVSRNGGAVSKVKVYRWQGRILSGAAGDTFAFGTSDGRSLSMAPMTCPTTLVNPSGVSGTAACDTAGPPLWSPGLPHIQLAATGSAFTISADGTERIVFIAEQDPAGVWSPLRWVRHSATRDTRVRCNYRNVALANYAGATLSIVAPTGSTVGGVNVPMSLPIPLATGTTWIVNSVATMKTAIAGAVAGDHIAGTGTIALDVAITEASFTANQLAGKKGAEGIVIRSASGNAADFVLTGDTGTNGNWSLAQAGATLYASLKDLTFDGGLLAISFLMNNGGKFYLQNVIAKGGTSAVGGIVTGTNTTGPLLVDILNCQGQDTAHDVWQFTGSSGGPNDATSLVRLINTSGLRAGPAGSDQCATTHSGLDIQIYAGLYSDANTNVIANGGSPQPKTYCFFVTTSFGTRNGGLADVTGFGMDITLKTGSASNYRFSRFTGTVATIISISDVARTIEHNIVTTASTRAVQVSVGASSVFGNIFIGCSEGVRCGSAVGVQPSSGIYQNTFVSNPNAMNFTSTDTPTTVRNNAAKTSGTSIGVSSGAIGALTVGDYNTVDPTVSVNYTPGANDLVAGDAALDADYFPTASGNCDGNGDTALVDYVGDADPFGFVLIYKPSRVSRGARDIPAIYASAVLQPDLF